MLTKSVFFLLDLFYTQRRAIAIPFLNKSFVKHYKNAYSYSNANTTCKKSSPYPLFLVIKTFHRQTGISFLYNRSLHFIETLY